MFFRLKKSLLIPAKNLAKWEAILLVTLAVAVLWCGQLTLKQQEMAGHMIRLHVLANSDSEADQALKLQVRDAVLVKAASCLAGVEDVKTAEQRLAASLEELAAEGEQVVAAAGYHYSVTAQLETTHFPTKSYGGFALPAGEYRALRVIIGEGEGQNWWCVVFPTLCVSAASEWETTAVSGGMTEDEISIMTAEDGVTLRFKCLEILDWIKQRLRFT